MPTLAVWKEDEERRQGPFGSEETKVLGEATRGEEGPVLEKAEAKEGGGKIRLVGEERGGGELFLGEVALPRVGEIGLLLVLKGRIFLRGEG